MVLHKLEFYVQDISEMFIQSHKCDRFKQMGSF